MVLQKYDKSPTVSDTILFTLETVNTDGLLETPANVQKIVICRIEQGAGDQLKSFCNKHLEDKYKSLRSKATENPCQENILKLRDAKHKMQVSAFEHTLAYKEAVPIFSVGNREQPVLREGEGSWVGTGVFEYEWSQENLLQGDYVVQWTWVLKTGEVLSGQKEFVLRSDKEILTAQPTRYTPDDKYDMLMKLYMPNMYNFKMKKTDITPQVLQGLNSVVANGFTFLEDLANELLDIPDPNLARKETLPLLANFFNLRLTSEDVTRWRRQILRAVPLCKRKGTIAGLQEALDQAGIKLAKITKLWQIRSQYIHTDGFVVNKDQLLSPNSIPVVVGTVIGELSHRPHNLDDIKVQIWSSHKEQINVPSECISFIEPLDHSENHLVLWNGLQREPNIPLFANDVVTVTYVLKPVPESRQSLEDYLLKLPLMDNSHPLERMYPPKNWNTRVIEDDDPLFHALITERHPLSNPVVFGKVRTTFLYSEKVYNMDAFDGTLRDSFNPCAVDKEFVDSCSYCQSSKFNADVEIENLSSDRVHEAMDIIEEYAPFHARLHFLNVTGAINEFIVAPMESIETLATVSSHDKVQPTASDEITGSNSISCTIEYKDGAKEEVIIKD